MITKGNKVNEMRDIVELGKKVKEYVKKYSDYTFSITTDKFAGGRSMTVCLVSGKGNLVKDGKSTQGIYLNHYYIEDSEVLSDEAKAMFIDIRDFIEQYHYVDSDMYTDYYNTNFYYDLKISSMYIDERVKVELINKDSFAKTYADLYRQLNGKKVKFERYDDNGNKEKEFVGIFNMRSKSWEIENEDHKKMYGDVQNKFTRILSNGFEKIDGVGKVWCRYEIV